MSKKKLTPAANDAFARPSYGKNGEFTLGLDPAALDDIVENKMRVLDFDTLDGPYGKLSPANQRALAHLVRAAEYLDDVFLKQDHPDNLRAKAALEKAAAKGDKTAQEALKVFTMHNGLEGPDLYAPAPKNFPLFADKSLAPGKGLYPQDLTQKELGAYIVAHPEQASALLSNNTIVRRSGKRLEALPYSVAFRAEMEGAAKELLAAARETDHAGLASYLRWQAQALVNDSDAEATFSADKAWIALEDSPLEFTIGRESYEDTLSAAVAADPDVRKVLDENGIKAKAKDSIGVRVGIVNTESMAEIADYRKRLSDVAAIMPLKEEYASQGVGDTKMTFADVDLVSVTGDYAAVRGGMTVAQNLPNSDKLAVQAGEGSRLVFHRQVRQGNDPAQRKLFLDALIDPAQQKWDDANANFLFTVGHELGHSLGPVIAKDGSDKKSALGAHGGTLEENKADLISIVMTELFKKQGKFDAEQANKIYLTWIAGCLPSKRPAPEAAHLSRALMQLNYFRAHGAVKLEKGGKLSIVPEKMAEAANAMLTEVIRLQLDGDAKKAAAFVGKHTAWDETLQYVADTRMSLKPRLYRLPKQPLREKLLKAAP